MPTSKGKEDATMKWTAGGWAVLALAAAGPLSAQEPGTAADRVTLNILRECAKIADTPARVACYDRNIGVTVAQAAAPLPAAPRDAAPAAQFGANQLPAPQRPAEQRIDRITATVTAASQQAPGIWLLTLADGTQWQLVDAAGASFDPPRKGSQIEIAAATLGSYILRYRGQTGLRIRRVS